VKRIVAIVLILGLLPAGAGAAEPAPEDRAFVETAVREGPWVVGEAVRLVLRVGYEQEWFESHAVPLFHRTLDVPLQADAPWLRKVADAAPAPDAAPPPAEADLASIALNGEPTPARRVADVERGGRLFAVLEAERTWRPSRAGTIAVAAPTLRFAHATKFRDDLLQGRTAVDPRDVVLRGSARSLEVLPLPAEGRPAGFLGYVGRYTVRAEADRAEAVVGEMMKVRLVVTGEGNLDLLPPPPLGDLPGFHVYGTLDVQDPDRRTLTYEVAPLDASLRAVPPIAFAFYDPEPPGGYRVVHTEPVPLAVRPGATPTPAVPAVPPAAAADDPTAWVAVAVALMAVTALLVLRVRRRYRLRTEALDERALRARQAAQTFHALAARPGADMADAFAAVLAARLDVPPAAVVSPDLADRLVRSGISPDVADQAARTLEALVGARYGGLPPDPALTVGLVHSIES
jgi:hypothetical protein